MRPEPPLLHNEWKKQYGSCRHKWRHPFINDDGENIGYWGWTYCMFDRNSAYCRCTYNGCPMMFGEMRPGACGVITRTPPRHQIYHSSPEE